MSQWKWIWSRPMLRRPRWPKWALCLLLALGVLSAAAQSNMSALFAGGADVVKEPALVPDRPAIAARDDSRFYLQAMPRPNASPDMARPNADNLAALTPFRRPSSIFAPQATPLPPLQCWPDVDGDGVTLVTDIVASAMDPDCLQYLPLLAAQWRQPRVTPTPTPGGPVWLDVSSWVYQLSGYRDDGLGEIAGTRFDLAVVDLARDGGGDYFTPTEIAAVRATGKIVLAYFEIGAIEDYRPEWSSIPQDLLLGTVSGWPGERYVKYWDERWWPVVSGRVDQAIRAGFDGAYLDMIVTYDEIPANAAGTNRADLAQKMVDLIARTSQYAKEIAPRFKIVPQNAPELYVLPGYLGAIDGLGMEELYYLATDIPCSYDWCAENRQNAAAVRSAGKLVLTVDYANNAAHIADAYTRSRAAGFVPYVTVRDLNIVRINPGWDP